MLEMRLPYSLLASDGIFVSPSVASYETLASPSPGEMLSTQRSIAVGHLLSSASHSISCTPVHFLHIHIFVPADLLARSKIRGARHLICKVWSEYAHLVLPPPFTPWITIAFPMHQIKIVCLCFLPKEDFPAGTSRSYFRSRSDGLLGSRAVSGTQKW